MNTLELLKNIEQAKQEWETAIDALPQLICLLDEEQRIIRANRIVEIWGLADVKTVAGTDAHALFHPNCHNASCPLKLFWQDARKATAQNQSISREITDPDSHKIFYYQVIPVTQSAEDSNGATTQKRRCVVIISDITQQKYLEKQLLQNQKMQAIGQLAGGIAHDFNNLLTAIIGYSQFIISGLPNTSPLYDDLVEIKKAGERAAALTGQLLAFGRKQVLMPEVLDLNNLIYGMEKLLERLVGENVVLLFSPEQTLGTIKADPSQIEQVLINLAVNARDAMPQGGEVIIKTYNFVANDDFRQKHANFTDENYVACEVTDTGTGMDGKIQMHIFEPFFTTKPVGHGTGLGLSTVHGIITQSGGFIEVESTVNEGSTFTFYFPCIEFPRTSAHGSDDNDTEVQTSKGTVLITEDDEMVRSLIELLLSRTGYQVLSAEDGDEAIRLCEATQKPIDFLITDVIMPGTLNGIRLSEKLQANYPNLKSIFISGHMNNTVVQQLTLSPDLPFLQKPFSPHDLLNLLQKI